MQLNDAVNDPEPTRNTIKTVPALNPTWLYTLAIKPRVTLANTMTTVMLERTREIGLMKALGASRGDVLRLFLGEAVGMGLLGGGCGALLGALAGLAVDRLGRSYLFARGAPPSLSIDLPTWLFVVALLASGLAAGLGGFHRPCVPLGCRRWRR